MTSSNDSPADATAPGAAAGRDEPVIQVRDLQKTYHKLEQGEIFHIE